MVAICSPYPEQDIVGDKESKRYTEKKTQNQLFSKVRYVAQVEKGGMLAVIYTNPRDSIDQKSRARKCQVCQRTRGVPKQYRHDAERGNGDY